MPEIAESRARRAAIATVGRSAILIVMDLAVRSFRLGFVIARADAALPWLPEQRYRGLDRLPFVPFLHEVPPDEATIWTAYLNAQDSPLAGDLHEAQRIRDALETVGTRTEVIYAEAMVVAPTTSPGLSGSLAMQHDRNLAWLDARSSSVPAAPPGFDKLGYDVCSPIPDYHSAIFQPGLIPKDAALAGQLNDAGLIRTEDAALGFMRTANTADYSLADLMSVILILSDSP